MLRVRGVGLLGGGTSCVVKRSGLAEGVAIPALTLAHAGHAVMCRSDAWTSKMVTSAWCVWVFALTSSVIPHAFNPILDIPMTSR